MSVSVPTTKHCSNCKRDVAETNFVMHEVHCRRNIILCSKCNEPVPKVQLEEHIEENHSLVDCDLCSQEIERSHLDEHKAAMCTKRDKICSYCSLSVKADEFANHESYCGTRTEQCVKCQSYIMHKDKAIHDESDCNLPERTESTSKVDFIDNHLPGVWNNFLLFAPEFKVKGDEEHDEYSRKNGRYVDPYADLCLDLPRYHPKNSNSSFHSSAARNDVAHGRMEPDRMHASERNKHLEDDKIFDEFLKFTALRNMNTVKEVNGLKDYQLYSEQDAEYLPCEFCDESFPLDVIIQHQAMCSNQFEDPGHNVFRDYGANLYENMAESGPEKKTLPSSLMRELTMLPCEFCSEPFANEELISHQLTCEVGDYLNNYATADHFGNVRRPPSLPSGLNKLGAEKAESGSSLRSSTSIPFGLSRVESSSRIIPMAVVTKPRLAAGTNRPKNLAGVRKPISRQLPQEEQAANTNSVNYSGHQMKEDNGSRAFRGAQTHARRQNNFYENPLSRLHTETAGVNYSRTGGSTNKPNSTMNLSVISKQNAGADHSKPPGTTGVNPLSFQTNNSSRLTTTTTTRIAATGQTGNQPTRSGNDKQEREIGARRANAAMTASNNQRKNSRSCQDPQGSC